MHNEKLGSNTQYKSKYQNTLKILFAIVFVLTIILIYKIEKQAIAQTMEKLGDQKVEEPLNRYLDKEYGIVCYELGGISCVKI